MKVMIAAGTMIATEMAEGLIGVRGIGTLAETAEIMTEIDIEDIATAPENAINDVCYEIDHKSPHTCGGVLCLYICTYVIIWKYLS
jgi:hypothetical protein